MNKHTRKACQKLQPVPFAFEHTGKNMTSKAGLIPVFKAKQQKNL